MERSVSECLDKGPMKGCCIAGLVPHGSMFNGGASVGRLDHGGSSLTNGLLHCWQMVDRDHWGCAFESHLVPCPFLSSWLPDHPKVSSCPLAFHHDVPPCYRPKHNGDNQLRTKCSQTVSQNRPSSLKLFVLGILPARR